GSRWIIVISVGPVVVIVHLGGFRFKQSLRFAFFGSVICNLDTAAITLASRSHGIQWTRCGTLITSLFDLHRTADQRPVARPKYCLLPSRTGNTREYKS